MEIDKTNSSPHMQESDIRPVNLVSGQIEAYNNDIKRLQQKRDDFVHVCCPACGTRASHKAFEKYTFLFVTCDACKTLYMNPRPTPEIMASYYQGSENYRYWAKHTFPASEAARKERLYKPWVSRIKEICEQRTIPRVRLLEIGAGFGGFAETALESGFFEDILIVEPTPEMAASCRSRGLNVIEKRVEDVERDEIGEVNLLVSFEVIEHLFEPESFFIQADRLLGPGGLLVVSCPNGQGFDVITLQAASTAIDSEHVNLFNIASLTSMLERNGFEAIEVTTPGRLDAELVRNAILAGKVTIEEPFLKKVLIEEWETLGAPFQDFLAANNLSSHMWAYAQRKA